MKEFAKDFYNHKAWQDCRDSYISKRIRIDGGMCEECHDHLGEIVHHRIELNAQNIKEADIAYGHHNMEYVCHECHNKIHDVFQRKSIVMFDENGDIIPPFAQKM